MADTAIGKAALVLSTDSAQLKGGLTETEKDAKGWATRVAGSISGTFSGGLLKGFEKIGGGLLSGPIGSLAGRLLGPFGGAIATGLESTLDKAEELRKLVVSAKSLGIDASQYQGLTKVFGKVGIEGDAVNATLVTMSKLVNDAAYGYGTAFGKASHAFEQLGIDAKQLAVLHPDEQFKAIATALTQVHNPAEQAAIAAHIFGTRAADLLPQLQKGGEGIQAFIDEQKRFGAVLSTDQINTAASAGKAWKEAKNTIAAAWDGLTNRAAVAGAPLIETAAKGVAAIMEFAAPVFEWFGRGLGAVAEIVAAIAKEIGGCVKWIVDEIGGWISQMFNLGNTTTSIRDVIYGAFKLIGKIGAGAFDLIMVAASPFLWVLGQIIRALGEVGDALLGLIRAIPADLKPAWLDNFEKGAQVAVNGAKHFGKAMADLGEDRIKGLLQGDIFRNARAFDAWVEKLKNRQKEETKEAVNEARAQFDVLDKEQKGRPKFDNAALIRGSTAEVSARLKYEMGGKWQEQQLAEQRKTNGLLGGIKDAIKPAAAGLGGAVLLAL